MMKSRKVLDVLCGALLCGLIGLSVLATVASVRLGQAFAVASPAAP